MEELELEAKIEEQMDQKGYVLLYSELFQDYVAFYLTEDALVQIPAKYVTYSDEELRAMFVNKRLNAPMLRFIHNCKKLFGTVMVEDSQLTFNMVRSQDACPACGSTSWWQRPDGGRVCGACHPKPRPHS